MGGVNGAIVVKWMGNGRDTNKRGRANVDFGYVYLTPQPPLHFVAEGVQIALFAKTGNDSHQPEFRIAYLTPTPSPLRDRGDF
jgi:hypothetical protein